MSGGILPSRGVVLIHRFGQPRSGDNRVSGVFPMAENSIFRRVNFGLLYLRTQVTLSGRPAVTVTSAGAVMRRGPTRRAALQLIVIGPDSTGKFPFVGVILIRPASGVGGSGGTVAFGAQAKIPGVIGAVPTLCAFPFWSMNSIFTFVKL